MQADSRAVGNFPAEGRGRVSHDGKTSQAIDLFRLWQASQARGRNRLELRRWRTSAQR